MSNVAKPKVSPQVLVLGVLTLLALTFLTLAIFLGLRSKPDASPATPKSTPSVTQAPTEEARPVTHGATGKSLEQDRKDALAAAQALIAEAGVSPEKKDAASRILALDKLDFSQVSPKLEKGVRFPAETPEQFKAQTYQALITMHTVLAKKNPGQEIKPASADGYQKIMVDAPVGIAQVPMDVFTGNETSFSMQMVYIDGKWQLNPYPLLESVKLSSALAEVAQQQGATPPAKD